MNLLLRLEHQCSRELLAIAEEGAAPGARPTGDVSRSARVTEVFGGPRRQGSADIKRFICAGANNTATATLIALEENG